LICGTEIATLAGLGEPTARTDAHDDHPRPEPMNPDSTWTDKIMGEGQRLAAAARD
jgi:hypothetical protein